MGEQLQGVLWTAFGLVVVTVIGVIGNALVKRMRTRATEPEMWDQLNHLTMVIYGNPVTKDPGLLYRVSEAESRAGSADRKAKATGHLVRDLSRQWKGDPPRLNPNDLAELDVEYIPAEHPWRQKPETGDIKIPTTQ